MNRYRITIRRDGVLIARYTVNASTESDARAMHTTPLSNGDTISVDDVTVRTDVTGVGLPPKLEIEL